MLLASLVEEYDEGIVLAVEFSIFLIGKECTLAYCLPGEAQAFVS